MGRKPSNGLCKKCGLDTVPEYRKRNRRYVCQTCVPSFNSKEERKQQKVKYRVNKRTQVFDHYGHECAYCGAAKNLQIDHIDGKGKEHRLIVKGVALYAWLIRNNFPNNFQTLCRQCNIAKQDMSDQEFRAWVITMANRFLKS